MHRRCVTVLLASLLLFACRDPIAPDALLVQPTCLNPAPLFGKFDPRAPGYIVVFHDHVDARQETARLAEQYDFEPTHIYQFALQGFSADLTPAVVASLRCEPSVEFVEHNQVFTLH